MTRLEDTDSLKNAFEISGPLIECITAVCQGPNEANKWVELLATDPIMPIKSKAMDAAKTMTSSAVNFSPSSSHVSREALQTKQPLCVCDNDYFLFLFFVYT